MPNEITKLQSLYDELATFLTNCNIEFKSPEKPHFTLKVKNLKELKVACIMDELSFFSYSPECNLLEITPNDWRAEIKSFSPDMLFIESAWQGKNGTWYRKIANGSEELCTLISFCKEENIPVVYWGKEDPLYTNTFMAVASLADFVFTTDIDSIQTYKIETSNPHVYHLHFAAQPLHHNPIELHDRKKSFCFAGSYYHRQIERSLLFDAFADYFISTKGLDIYDRNHNNRIYSMPEYSFPEKYKPYILGHLPSEEIDKAYKGYLFGININTITQSQTMFARRVFELLASNTVVAGNFSQGVKNYFGELTVCTDGVATLHSTLLNYCNEPTLHKYRLKGLRKVLSEHLYEDRLSYIVEKVFGKNIKPALPHIAILSDATNEENKMYIKASFERQTHKNKSLHFSSSTLCEKEIDYVAYFSPEDYYGVNYLLDMALATRYLSKEVDGISKGVNQTYSFIDTLYLRNGIVKPCLIKPLTELQEKGSLVGNFFSIDRFNYCRNYQGDICVDVDDIAGLNEGFSLSDIQNVAESVHIPDVDTHIAYLSNNQIVSSFNTINAPNLLKSNTLILSNTYPSYDNLYRNMFVHSRVKAYQREGYHFDVLCSNFYSGDVYREFDGVQVIDGQIQVLSNILNSGKIKTICVHFLDEQMFTAIEPYLQYVRLLVWVHGSEIQPWWRREYNYSNDKELERAKTSSDIRMALWSRIFSHTLIDNMHFVFVSQYFADEVMEDYKITLPRENYSIIHNMIDTNTFNYIEKDISQRKKIFSCRPFASQKYANDLSVKAIQVLSKCKEFSDMHFHIAGSGKQFKEITAPLRKRKYNNVTIEERFYTHDELAALHKEYGVCLIPSRMDAQGVSRDEAMSSGLVPITTAVAAIPEFVDEQCGILVPNEDWQGLADGILKLYHNPELFKQLSINAALRVRKQSAAGFIIQKELALILK